MPRVVMYGEERSYDNPLDQLEQDKLKLDLEQKKSLFEG
jgi:hypothetical protein